MDAIGRHPAGRFEEYVKREVLDGQLLIVGDMDRLTERRARRCAKRQPRGEVARAGR